jgi:hypothetical protein
MFDLEICQKPSKINGLRHFYDFLSYEKKVKIYHLLF